MRRFAFALALSLVWAGPSRACGPVLVSGFDDVMRQADNTGVLRAARRLLSADVTYAGMPELYHELTCGAAEPRMYVVSAITVWLQARAHAFLARAGFPPARVYFRRWLLQWSPERFKWARFERLLEIHAGRRFIFVLDNSPTSVRLSERLLKAHRPRIAAVYLRETIRRGLPAGVTPFVTAADIAMSEFAAGRMTSREVTRVADAVLAASDPHRIIPAYSYCPVARPACASDEAEVMRQCARVRALVLAICAARARPPGTPSAQALVRLRRRWAHPDGHGRAAAQFVPTPCCSEHQAGGAAPSERR